MDYKQIEGYEDYIIFKTSKIYSKKSKISKSKSKSKTRRKAKHKLPKLQNQTTNLYNESKISSLDNLYFELNNCNKSSDNSL